MENREVLLDGKLKIYNPEANYSMAESELNSTKICVCYSRNIVEASGADFIVVNGTGENFIAVKANGYFKYTIRDCKGVCVNSGKQHIKDVEIFDVPQSGVLQLVMI